MKKCIVPTCERNSESRGLCWPCYRAAYRKVMAGKFTWEQLESQGWALPARHRGNKGGAFIQMVKSADNKEEISNAQEMPNS